MPGFFEGVRAAFGFGKADAAAPASIDANTIKTKAAAIVNGGSTVLGQGLTLGRTTKDANGGSAAPGMGTLYLRHSTHQNIPANRIYLDSKDFKFNGSKYANTELASLIAHPVLQQLNREAGQARAGGYGYIPTDDVAAQIRLGMTSLEPPRAPPPPPGWPSAAPAAVSYVKRNLQDLDIKNLEIVDGNIASLRKELVAPALGEIAKQLNPGEWVTIKYQSPGQEAFSDLALVKNKEGSGGYHLTTPDQVGRRPHVRALIRAGDDKIFDIRGGFQHPILGNLEMHQTSRTSSV